MAKYAAKSGSPRPPSVERVLAVVRERLDGTVEPSVVRDAARQVVDDERARLGAGETSRDVATLGAAVEELLGAREHGWREGLLPVINATGVIVHTNLGRAPWPEEAGAIAVEAARTYLLLELDRETGRRGHRYRAGEDALVELTGAEDALVTNNNAAAVALAVGLAGRGGVAVSRGELVEIGGGVRIPEIVRRAGARLIEVGTTNRTRAADFEEPLADGRARLVLRVHPSNFTQSGFVEVPDARAVAELAHRHGAIVVDDLGSGALLDTTRFGLTHEPMPSERLEAGSDVVTFSGDKLVGGPQAGLVVGRAALIAKMRKDPLARAMRPDKATLAAVAATLGLYRAGRAESAIPVWRMIATPSDTLREQAESLVGALEGDGAGAPVAVEVRSTIGGGSLPGETISSWGVALAARSPDRVVAALRRGSPCVLARVEDGRVILDLRTVLEDPLSRLPGAIAAALGRAREP